MELSKVILTILSFMVPQIVTQLESEKICGKLFSDPISNFIGSDLILKVQLTNHSEVYNQNEKYTQVFKVLKNYIDWIQVDDLVEVGFFGRQDPAKCVAGEMREDLIYTIFVDFEYDGIHSLSAMPILWDESTDRVFDDLVYNPDSEKDVLLYVSYQIFCFIINLSFSKFALIIFLTFSTNFFNTQTFRSFDRTFYESN